MGYDGVFAFASFEDLVHFVNWVTSSFDDPQEFKDWIESRTLDFAEIDNQFWSIIEHGYYSESNGSDLPSSD
jgi:hypothetical protein